MHSIKSVLTEAAGILASSSASAALDAEILLSLTLNKERSHLRAWPDKPLEPDQINVFWTLIQQRQQGTPIAYLTGNPEVCSRDFHDTTNSSS